MKTSTLFQVAAGLICGFFGVLCFCAADNVSGLLFIAGANVLLWTADSK